MVTVTFKIKSTAVLASLYVAPHDKLQGGGYANLEPDESGVTADVQLPEGLFAYVLVLRAGQPGSHWGMTIQRRGNPSTPRAGLLNTEGDGGDVNVITIA